MRCIKVGSFYVISVEARENHEHPNYRGNQSQKVILGKIQTDAIQYVSYLKKIESFFLFWSLWTPGKTQATITMELCGHKKKLREIVMNISEIFDFRKENCNDDLR